MMRHAPPTRKVQPRDVANPPSRSCRTWNPPKSIMQDLETPTSIMMLLHATRHCRSAARDPKSIMRLPTSATGGPEPIAIMKSMVGWPPGCEGRFGLFARDGGRPSRVQERRTNRGRATSARMAAALINLESVVRARDATSGIAGRDGSSTSVVVRSCMIDFGGFQVLHDRLGGAGWAGAGEAVGRSCWEKLLGLVLHRLAEDLCDPDTAVDGD
jgi:hypothetical protein